MVELSQVRVHQSSHLMVRLARHLLLAQPRRRQGENSGWRCLDMYSFERSGDMGGLSHFPNIFIYDYSVVAHSAVSDAATRDR